MSSALCPEGGPSRLIRFVEPGTLPDDTLVSLFDPRQNLLLIDRELFESLPYLEKHIVLHTTRKFIEITSVTKAD